MSKNQLRRFHLTEGALARIEGGHRVPVPNEIPDERPEPKPEVSELLAITQRRDGIWGIESAADAPLLGEHPAVVRRIKEGPDYRTAFMAIIEKAISMLGTTDQRDAAYALLGFTDRQASPRRRLDSAAEALKISVDKFSRTRQLKEHGPWLTEARVTLLDTVLANLNRVTGPTPEGEARLVDAIGDVLGTWKGVLETSWERGTERWPGPRDSYLVFKRHPNDPSRLVTRHYVDDGGSVMVSQEIVDNTEGNRRLLGIYEAEAIHPGDRMRENPRHRGAMLLDLIDNPATELRGHYWTDRETVGTLVYQRQSKKTASDFEGASELF